MDLAARLDLVKQVGEEIVTEDELRALLEAKPHPIAYDGFEPSGTAHIAQGVMRAINVNKMTRAGCRFKMFVADWHAWANNKMGGDLEKIQTTGKYLIEIWRATGMDLSKVDFVWASEFIEDESYWKKVMNIARDTSLDRVLRTTQIMGRSEKDKLSASQILYPCMQAADIFHLEADLTQLGMDQRKVNMLAREAGPKLGFWKPVVVSHHMLMGLTQPPAARTNIESGAALLAARKYVEDILPSLKTPRGQRWGRGMARMFTPPATPLSDQEVEELQRALEKAELEMPEKGLRVEDEVFIDQLLANVNPELAKRFDYESQEGKARADVEDASLELAAKALFHAISQDISSDTRHRLEKTLESVETRRLSIGLRRANAALRASLKVRESSTIENATAMKMSKSNPDSAIFMTDTPQQVQAKVKKAYCPEKQVADNPILEYFRYIVFERFPSVKVDRPAKFGGDLEFTSHAELERAFVEGRLHPADAKSACATYVNLLLDPVREHFEKNAAARELKQQVERFKVTR